MNKMKSKYLRIMKKPKPILLGFTPETDCAPIVVAHEMALFKKYGIDVALQRELSWKNIQDKITRRQLDAGQAPGALPFLINLGLSPEKCECVSSMVLSLQGNAITISRTLWNAGVRDAETLREHIVHDKRTYTFGVGSPLGSQYSLLCQWLKTADIPHNVKVRIMPAPAPQMFPLLKMGYLDGYCIGEPWNSVAVQAGVGVCVTTSAQLAPLHPEKVLLVRKEFAETRAGEHQALIAALLEACEFCDQPQNRNQLCDLLALPQYVNAPVECFEASLLGRTQFGDNSIHSLHGLNVFYRYRANDPTTAKAAWITGRLYDFLRWDARPAALDKVFGRDVFLRAKRRFASERMPKNIARETARRMRRVTAGA
jgi:ABC-type nitrate/sulfonate/bicarbonate transport system substrate-binding protein